MRAVDIQAINAQTPGVERAHQNRPQQSEVEQRQLASIAQRAQDVKMTETQRAPESREVQVQIEKEQERKRDTSKKDQGRGKTDQDENNEQTFHRGKNLTTGRKVDIII